MLKSVTKRRLISIAIAAELTTFLGLFTFSQADIFDRQTVSASGGLCQFVAHPLGLTEPGCSGTSVAPKPGIRIRPLEHQRSGTPEAVELISGEKSIFAGTGVYLSAAIVETSDGAVVPDGTPVSFTRNGNKIGTAKTLGGIAFVLDGRITEAGEYNVVARSMGRSSQSNTIKVVAAEPVNIGIEEDVTSSPDGDKFTKLKTMVLEDRFGNTVPDGSLLQYKGNDSEGRGVILNSLVVNGISSVDLPGRELGGAFSLEPRYAEISGAGLQLDIPQIIITASIQAAVHIRRGIVDLELGPMETSKGEPIHDGLPISIDMADGRRLETRTLEGFARFRFTHPSPGRAATVNVRTGSQHWAVDIDYASEGHSVTNIREEIET